MDRNRLGFRAILHHTSKVHIAESKVLKAMYSYQRYATIDEDNVRRALDNLRYTSRETTCSLLENLLLVDLLLMDPTIPYGPHARRFALAHLLTTLIQDRLAQHRAKYDLSPPCETEHFHAAQTTIACDAKVGNIELLGWSWLYYFFVRTDLNVTQELFAQLIHVDGRSVRRYQQHAIRCLTSKLIEQEWRARKAHQRRRLCTYLPVAKPVQLIGREPAFVQMDHLVNTLGMNHIQVNGAPGIGKTSFVQEFLRTQIESELLTTIIWISQPTTVVEIEQCLLNQLLLRERHTSLREYVSFHRIVVVLDDLSALNASAEVVEDLLDDLSEAMVILIINKPLLLLNVTARVQLNELEPAAALTLIQRLADAGFQSNGEHLSEDELWSVWNIAGGNPLMIKRALHTLLAEEV